MVGVDVSSPCRNAQPLMQDMPVADPSRSGEAENRGLSLRHPCHSLAGPTSCKRRCSAHAGVSDEVASVLPCLGSQTRSVFLAKISSALRAIRGGPPAPLSPSGVCFTTATSRL